MNEEVFSEHAHFRYVQWTLRCNKNIKKYKKWMKTPNWCVQRDFVLRVVHHAWSH